LESVSLLPSSGFRVPSMSTSIVGVEAVGPEGGGRGGDAETAARPPNRPKAPPIAEPIWLIGLRLVPRFLTDSSGLLLAGWIADGAGFCTFAVVMLPPGVEFVLAFMNPVRLALSLLLPLSTLRSRSAPRRPPSRLNILSSVFVKFEGIDGGCPSWTELDSLRA
jgi:hypothetical protein